MNKILNNMEVKEFVKEHKIECYSIIIKIDKKNKKASYVIDGNIIVKANYEEIVKYMN